MILMLACGWGGSCDWCLYHVRSAVKVLLQHTALTLAACIARRLDEILQDSQAGTNIRCKINNNGGQKPQDTTSPESSHSFRCPCSVAWVPVSGDAKNKRETRIGWAASS
jgi:hypothetical protein